MYSNAIFRFIALISIFVVETVRYYVRFFLNSVCTVVFSCDIPMVNKKYTYNYNFFRRIPTIWVLNGLPEALFFEKPCRIKKTSNKYLTLFLSIQLFNIFIEKYPSFNLKNFHGEGIKSDLFTFFYNLYYTS